jgi:hypothetical protein
MSADAVGWVYRHSPYTGVTFQVHQAVADSVNDQHGNEFWLAKPKLSVKARTSVASAKRAMEMLTADGFLELLEESGGRAGSRYLFLFPDVPVVYDSRATGSPRTGSSGRANRLTGNGQPAHQSNPTGSPESENVPHKERSQENPKGTQLEPKAIDYFAAFWKVYPLKTSKGAARKAWLKAVKAAGDPDRIVQGAYRFSLDPNRVDEFTPYPATWLNGERWEDDPLPPRGTNGTKPTKLQRTFDVIDEVFDRLESG